MIAMLFPPALAGISFLPAAAAAVADRRTRRIPDVLVALAFVPSALAVVLSHHPTHLAFSAASGAALMALPLLILHLVSPAAMGFGDVKLAAALGATIGVLQPVLAVPALAVASGLTLVVAGCRRRTAVP